MRPDGGIGRRAGLKILYGQPCEGSIPSLATNGWIDKIVKHLYASAHRRGVEQPGSSRGS
ncbi:MAG: hypothetical protein UY95_C0001G0006 [Parcubacteria group bacterium GW2011_GWA2_56_7]|nr:MAG: hypothetical protein UY95_C0001G0006 [Parcubacteria group bacterium GW2011_GWA2_56_7]